MNIPQFIYLFIWEGHLGCSQLPAIINKAAINDHVHIFSWTTFSFLLAKYLVDIYFVLSMEIQIVFFDCNSILITILSLGLVLFHILI